VKRGLLSILFLAGLLLLWVAPPSHASSPLPSAANVLYFQVDVLSIGSTSAIARFTTSAEYNSNITTVTVLSSVPRTVSGASQVLPVVFDHWDESAGLLGASKVQRVLIENVTSSFPLEQIDMRIWLGTNLSLASPVVSASLPTYIVTTTGGSVKLGQLTSSESSTPAIASLFRTYTHVFRLDVEIHHSLYFQFFAVIMTLIPLLLIALALVVVYLSIFKKPQSQTNTDYVNVLVGLFLFVPIFYFSIGQLIPTAQSEFIINWLGLIGALTAGSFLVVVGCIMVVIVKRG